MVTAAAVTATAAAAAADDEGSSAQVHHVADTSACGSKKTEGREDFIAEDPLPPPGKAKFICSSGRGPAAPTGSR